MPRRCRSDMISSWRDISSCQIFHIYFQCPEPIFFLSVRVFFTHFLIVLVVIFVPTLGTRGLHTLESGLILSALFWGLLIGQTILISKEVRMLD